MYSGSRRSPNRTSIACTAGDGNHSERARRSPRELYSTEGALEGPVRHKGDGETAADRIFDPRVTSVGRASQ